MVVKFVDFDEYQLAKYNKEKSRSARSRHQRTLKDVKHVKARLNKNAAADADDQNDEKTVFSKDIVEEKFIKHVRGGLKINDCIVFRVLVGAKCTSVKIDLAERDDDAADQDSAAATSRNKNNKTKRGKLAAKSMAARKKNVRESIALRINVDYTRRRIVKRSFVSNAWSKAQCISNPASVEFERSAPEAPVYLDFYVEANATQFTFGRVEDEDDSKKTKKKKNTTKQVGYYPHSSHHIDLARLNTIRVSGVGIKLKALRISTHEALTPDHDDDDDGNEAASSPQDASAQLVKRSYTLKQLIRQLHIARPVDHVMALIGKVNILYLFTNANTKIQLDSKNNERQTVNKFHLHSRSIQQTYRIHSIIHNKKGS